MSKAKPYPDRDADEQEPTNLGSQWEDEASTTVEQGDVAEKVRTVGFPKHNGNTNHTHTGTGVDEPTVDDQHAPVLSAITPIRQDNSARLIISQGNDAGQELEIRPGKSYTIGRGLDNDIVLTDIAVSRKHFDLKFEDGAWVIVDRGSGNGTVVNGNVEDNPFMLAHGDMIEIGNTVFRYDQPNGAPRESQRAFDEDEEMSTVAGKPLRQDHVDDPPPPPPRLQRPKTLPPPVPLRPAQVSTPQPLSYNHNPFQQPQPLQPASTLPMPQMANRPPLPMPMNNGPMVGPGSPTMIGDSMGMPMPAPMHLQNMPLAQNGMQSTIPGQGRPSYPYPQATEIPPHSVHAQMLMIQTQGRRGDGSTAHVAPAHYDPMIGMPPPQYGRPPAQLSKRTKLAIAGIALALLTGIVTAAVVKSGSKPRAAATAKKDTGKKETAKKIEKVETKKPTAEPILVPAKDAPKAPDPKGEVAKTEPKVEAKAPEPKVEAKAPEPKVEAKAPEPKVEPKVVAKAPEPKAQPTPKQQKKRIETRPEPAPKRVAVAVDSSAAVDKADALYRSKKFNDASAVLAKAAASAGEDEASDLRDKSKKYSLLGRAYSNGTAPAVKPVVAFAALQQASNLDANVGNAHQDEINGKRAAIAPKAAVAFAAVGDWGNARTAYLVAQRAGSSDPNLAIVKQKLEAAANELYAAANKEAASNPGPAKEKLKQIRALVDAKSPIAVKAQALLNRL